MESKLYQEIEQELAKQNALAEQKWQEALERSDVSLSVFEDIHTSGFASLNSRMSTYSSASKYYSKYYTIDFEFGLKYGNRFGYAEWQKMRKRTQDSA